MILENKKEGVMEDLLLPFLCHGNEFVYGYGWQTHDLYGSARSKFHRNTGDCFVVRCLDDVYEVVGS
jgi:hypothetical protein